MASMLSAFVILALATRAEAEPSCTGSQCPLDDEPTSLLQVTKAVKTGGQRSDESALVAEDMEPPKDICKKVCVTTNGADCGTAHAPNRCELFFRTYSAAGVSSSGQRFFISGPFDKVHKSMNDRNLPVKVEFAPQVGPPLDWVWLCVSKTIPAAGAQIKANILKMVSAVIPAVSIASAGSKSGAISQAAKELLKLGPIGDAIVDILNNPTSINIDSLEESIIEKYQADLVKAYGDKGIAVKLQAHLGFHDSEDNCMQFTNVVRDPVKKTAFVYYGEGANKKQLYLEKVMDFAVLLLASSDNKIQAKPSAKSAK